MRDEGRSGPPALTRFLFKLLLRGEGEETIWGDVEEGFEKRASERGVAYARWWYRRQALTSVWALWMARLQRVRTGRPRTGPRAGRGDGMMRTALRDIRYAGRGLLKTPVQTAAAIIALGLGIGLTATMFSGVYATFYRALPFEDAERLVRVERRDFRAGVVGVSVHDFVEWRDAQRSFTDFAAEYTGTIGFRGSEEATQLAATFVTWNALRILGAQPALGRNFLEEDDQSGAPLVAVVSHRAWEERLGGDPGIVGQETVINGEPATIIGVMPDGFHFPDFQDIWMPLRLDADQVERGQGPSLVVFGHLRDGVTLDRANAEMDGLARRIAIDHPDTNEGIGARVVPYADFETRGLALLVNLLLLLSAIAVLLIACLNVANLLLARAALRTREIALRTAMGARRLQIMLLMLAESSTLAVVGGVLGAGVAWLGLKGVAYGLAVSGDAPYWMEFELDLLALAFTAGAAMLAGIVAGMIPAVRATTGNLTEFLKDGSHGATGLKIGRLSRSLVAVEVAFSTCLLIVAALIGKTLADVGDYDYPFAERGVLTGTIGLFDSTNPDEESRRRLFDQVLDRLGEVPGVEGSTLASRLPGLSTSRRPFGIEGRAYPSEEDYPLARSMAVSSGFFDLLGVEPVRGRGFSLLDRTGEQPVAIVNESFARTHFPDQDPVGQQLRLGRSGSTSAWRTIVGVVPDMLMQGLYDVVGLGGSGFYVPLAPGDNQSVSLLIRSQGAPLELTDGVRALIRSVDPDLAISDVNTLSAALDAENWYVRLVGAYYVVFGAAALFLALVGLFGVVSFGAARRTHEIGIRMAIGAKARGVVGLIVGQSVKYMALGLAVGVGLARLMAGALYPIGAGDPAMYAVIGALILLVGVLASLVPAIRAARSDPVRALQSH